MSKDKGNMFSVKKRKNQAGSHDVILFRICSNLIKNDKVNDF